MTEHKLVRVNDRLYEEHLEGTSSRLEWVKRPEPLYLQLFDIVAVDGAEFLPKHGDFFTMRGAKPLPKLDSDNIAVDMSKLRSTKEILAKAKIERGDSIGFISG